MTKWRVANAIMLVLFAASVVVQVNDPDPLRWIAIYGAAALVCRFELVGGSRWWSPAIVALIALVWAAALAPGVIGKVPFSSMFAEFEMKDIGVEESREMYGLLLIAIWMSVVAIRSALRAKRADHHGSVA